jgi:hypothetical protein
VRERIHLLVGAFAALFQKAADAPLSLERKLEILAGCGFRLAAPFTVQDLPLSFSREQFEKPGFDLVLAGLGMTEERPPWRDHCVNLWQFDSECIEGDGSYRRIAERLRSMAQGSLPVENIRDHVDQDSGNAWLAFTYHGQEIRISCEVNDDWVDPGLFAHFVDLLQQSDPSKIFLSYNTGGQDSILACVTKTEFAKLKQLGIGFRPLH